MSGETFEDLEHIIELKNAEIDELNIDISNKVEKINKLKIYSTKLKYEKKNLEDKLDSKINYDKARLKELNDLEEKIKEKDQIIEDKQDQVKYQREIIEDYKAQLDKVKKDFDIRLKQLTDTYNELINQKDLIIEKQDKNIKNITKTNDDIIKSYNSNLISLKLQNEKFLQISDKLNEMLR